jgi:hypothetical protein
MQNLKVKQNVLWEKVKKNPKTVGGSKICISITLDPQFCQFRMAKNTESFALFIYTPGEYISHI